MDSFDIRHFTENQYTGEDIFINDIPARGIVKRNNYNNIQIRSVNTQPYNNGISVEISKWIKNIETDLYEEFAPVADKVTGTKIKCLDKKGVMKEFRVSNIEYNALQQSYLLGLS